jgi:hypothetical protein
MSLQAASQATIGVRKVFAYCVCILSVTLLAYFDKPIPEQIIWITGFFFGANLIGQQISKSSNGANGSSVSNGKSGTAGGVS